MICPKCNKLIEIDCSQHTRIITQEELDESTKVWGTIVDADEYT